MDHRRATDQREEWEGAAGGRKSKKKKMHTSQDKQIGEGTLHEKVLTWMIPERIVTVAATITLCSSNDE